MNQRQRHTPEQSAVESVLSTLWALLTLPFKGSRSRGIDAGTAALLSSHWQEVSDLLANPSTEGVAVSEADKLLDAALQAINLPGERMADRLKAAEGRWGREFSNEVWRAHKLRNQLAHEVGMQLAPGQAKIAVSTFQRALRYLGVPV